jgi:2-polyprenyl-6-methoxyphenol hydroxylase-like FAD-dependent oxidoreductase
MTFELRRRVGRTVAREPARSPGSVELGMLVGVDPILVVGAGIGGLTVALALTHQRIPCVVNEQAPELREIGAGLGLWPAPMQIFDRLGLGDEVRALSRPWEIGGLRRCDGRFLVRYTADEFAARLGEATIGVHRGELQALLLRSLPPAAVRTGSRCVGLRQPGDGTVVASFADGLTVRAPAVIAADGHRSRTRAILFGDRPLHDCKYVAWRGVATQRPATDWHVFAGETWGPAGRFGIFPITGERVTWYAAARTFHSDNPKDELVARFGDWHHPIPELLDATPEDEIWRDHIYDLRPPRRWSAGRVALVGDAAHPMTPELGQGACQAILDAWSLGEALAHSSDVPAAFRTYERNRKARARFVTLVARAVAVAGNADSRLARAAREHTTAQMPRAVLLHALDVVARDTSGQLLRTSGGRRGTLRRRFPRRHDVEQGQRKS